MPWRGAQRPGEYPSLGRVVAQWIEAACPIPDGVRQGDPYRLTDEMLVFLKRFYRLHPDAVYDEDRPSAPFVYRGAQLMRPQKWGKALQLDTLLPTPTGWTTIGAVRVGDALFDEGGRPCRVLGKSEVWTDTDCYRVRFSDRAEFVVSGDHLWHVERRNGGAYEPATIATHELVGDLVDADGARRFRVPNAAPLRLASVELPIDPYVLGAWLGDGDSDTGRITKPDVELFAEIGAAGYEVRETTRGDRRRIVGLTEELGDIELLGNKHIPSAYLRSSESQRRALLQGLMDTDGHCEMRGRCEFSTTLPALRDGVRELLYSLGIKHLCLEGVAILEGRAIGPKWRIEFSARDDMKPFRLARKAARLLSADRNHAQFRHRRIVEVERVASVPTQCITVDSPSQLFLAGREMVPTHNSPFGGTICLAEGLGPVRFDGWDANGEPVGRPQPTPWVQIVATSEDQTDNTWLAVHEMALRGAIADMGLDIGILDINLPNGGKIEPRTSSGRARLGARLTFALFDESHLMVSSNGGVTLATTMKRNIAGMGGRWLEISNAYDPSENSVAQRTQESGAEDVLIDYRPPPRRPDLDNEKDSRELLEYVYGDSYWVDLARVLADAKDPATCPTTADAIRFFFNGLEVGVSDAVDAARWDAAARPGELEKGTAIALGFDGSKSEDCTSIVASRISDGRWFHIHTWDPNTLPDHKVPKAEVDKVMAAAFDAYDVKMLVGDPPYWEEYFDLWTSRWGKERVVDYSTNKDSLMDDAVSRFLAAFDQGFTHDGNATLTAHAKQAALANGRRRSPRPDDRPSLQHYYLRVVKKREHVPMDAFIAGILAEVGRGLAIEKGALEPPAEPLVTWRGR